ncbi:MAG: c-type cytochrome, partial [Gammaproteobacteria bacterium]|nr:c-type cytochrome [Gammaproteobacteria bacterium]
MRARASSRRAAMVPGFVFAAVMACAVSAPLAAQEENALGRDVYDRWCASCHGYEGLGDGYAATYMLPRPRDFTQALYQIRTTASGQLPTDDDIMRVINEGMPGTTMPGWEEELSLEERLALVDYLKSFSRFFAAGEAPAPLTFSSPTRATEEALADGREVYELIECNRCHGIDGRGDGTSSPTLVDDAGMPTYSADLTENWYFNGGGTVEDIYQRLRTGLDGTPMPSFTDLIDAGVITDEQLWNLAHYVRSFAPEDPPGITEVIRAGLVEDAPLPDGVDDPLWESAEAFYIPLGGPIIESP